MIRSYWKEKKKKRVLLQDSNHKDKSIKLVEIFQVFWFSLFHGLGTIMKTIHNILCRKIKQNVEVKGRDDYDLNKQKLAGWTKIMFAGQ